MFSINVGDIAVPHDVRLPDNVPAVANNPVINAGEVDCLPGETQMIRDAYDDLQKVISSPDFRNAVLAAQFTEANGLDSTGVYNLMVERSPVTVGFTMFKGTFMQNHVWQTMGYEDPTRPDICFANRHFIQDKDVCASLVLHETMHVLGFSHEGDKSTSVPYTMNNIYTEVATTLGV